ncbi:hypothetical protein BpHYR1_036892 [Brachionus plicatilis]|uniref:Uncharacterized protein n=1 Tax=Brachionus plicatilis TaxID=10195 RepID=A0A3M7QS61_BRAPC|nr:hypothetical protein BpHYR1_036892 [Brachionus plicatilis]
MRGEGLTFVKELIQVNGLFLYFKKGSYNIYKCVIKNSKKQNFKVINSMIIWRIFKYANLSSGKTFLMVKCVSKY